MSRPLRIEYANAYYHVMNFARSRQKLFPSPAFYDAFLKCLNEATSRYELEVHAYCLLPNQYHLLVKTKRANLSRAMRHINGVYTQLHNKMKQVDGSVCKGRYKSIMLNPGEYLIQTTRYIHQLPILQRKKLAQSVLDYPYSSAQYYQSVADVPDWIAIEENQQLINQQDTKQNWLEYTQDKLDADTRSFYQRQRHPPIRGSREFKQKMLADKDLSSPEIASSALLEKRPYQQILKTVSHYFNVDESELLKVKRGRGDKKIPRWIAMKLCQDLTGMTLKQMADIFNVGHYCTISQTISRLKQQSKKDFKIDMYLNDLFKELDAIFVK
jgi:putative transposase